MTAEAARALQQLVVADADLVERLAAVDDRPTLDAALLALAAEHGLAVDLADLEAAEAAGGRRWIERWL